MGLIPLLLSFSMKIAAIKFVQDKKEIDEAKFNEECGVGMFIKANGFFNPIDSQLSTSPYHSLSPSLFFVVHLVRPPLFCFTQTRHAKRVL